MSPAAGTADPNPGNNSSTHTNAIADRTGISANPWIEVESNPRTAAYWQPNGTAKYFIIVNNDGPAVVAGAIVRVPPTEGLTKTAVTCLPGRDWTNLAIPGQCPSNPTVNQLERGIVVPNLPNQGIVTFVVDATVSAALGGTVTLTASVAPPTSIEDSSTGNDVASKTNSVLLPSGSSSPSSTGGDASAKLPTPAGSTLIGGTAPATCNLPGPTPGTPTVTATNVSFSWPHINGASYEVSRNGEIATPKPITSAVYPATLSFSQSATFYHHTTYIYTVTAQVQEGDAAQHRCRSLERGPGCRSRRQA